LSLNYIPSAKTAQVIYVTSSDDGTTTPERGRSSGFSMTLGILALVLGGLELAGQALHLPFDLPVFAILLMVFGIIILARNWMRERGA
jgi:hypothetical protein